MKVTLVRHTSVDVPKGYCYGWTDVPLNATFPEEASLTKVHLQQIIAEEGPFDKAYTSPLSRAVKLADFCGFTDAERDDRLKEINFGAWEMQPFEGNTDPQMLKWYDDYIYERATGGESFYDQFTRVSQFLDELKTKAYQRVVIFAHGGVLESARVYGGKILLKEIFTTIPPYGSTVQIDI